MEEEIRRRWSQLASLSGNELDEEIRRWNSFLKKQAEVPEIQKTTCISCGKRVSFDYYFVCGYCDRTIWPYVANPANKDLVRKYLASHYYYIFPEEYPFTANLLQHHAHG